MLFPVCDTFTPRFATRHVKRLRRLLNQLRDFGNEIHRLIDVFSRLLRGNPSQWLVVDIHPDIQPARKYRGIGSIQQSGFHCHIKKKRRSAAVGFRCYRPAFEDECTSGG